MTSFLLTMLCLPHCSHWLKSCSSPRKIIKSMLSRYAISFFYGVSVLFTQFWLKYFLSLSKGTKTLDVNSDLGVVSMMGYFKLSISFLKYLPQFYWNYKRKSTKGWSIANIILDLAGGTFSFAQMAL
jgi:hypothetical protein